MEGGREGGRREGERRIEKLFERRKKIMEILMKGEKYIYALKKTHTLMLIITILRKREKKNFNHKEIDNFCNRFKSTRRRLRRNSISTLFTVKEEEEEEEKEEEEEGAKNQVKDQLLFPRGELRKREEKVV